MQSPSAAPRSSKPDVSVPERPLPSTAPLATGEPPVVPVATTTELANQPSEADQRIPEARSLFLNRVDRSVVVWQRATIWLLAALAVIVAGITTYTALTAPEHMALTDLLRILLLRLLPGAALIFPVWVAKKKHAAASAALAASAMGDASSIGSSIASLGEYQRNATFRPEDKTTERLEEVRLKAKGRAVPCRRGES